MVAAACGDGVLYGKYAPKFWVAYSGSGGREDGRSQQFQVGDWRDGGVSSGPRAVQSVGHADQGEDCGGRVKTPEIGSQVHDDLLVLSKPGKPMSSVELKGLSA